MEENNETTIIRIKRKRVEEPLDSLVVAAIVKRGANDADEKESHVFRRIDTVDIKGDQKARIKRRIQRSFTKQHINESLEDRKSQRLRQQKLHKKNEVEKRRALVQGFEDVSLSEKPKTRETKSVFGGSSIKSRNKRNKIRENENDVDFVDVDLTHMLHHHDTSLGANSTGLSSPSGKSPSKVLNPIERRIDEAIFVAFNSGDASGLTQFMHKSSDTSFKRPADGTTPLMAAAWCGDLELSELIIRSGGNPNVQDVHGATAADLADKRGHILLAKVLREAMLEKDNHEFVFDIYCLDVKKTGNHSASKGAMEKNQVELVEPLQLSRREVEALRRRAQFKDEYGDDSESDGLVNEDSDSFEGGIFDEFDEDSNDEGCARNDYPDEEDGSEEDGGWMPGDQGDIYDDDAHFMLQHNDDDDDDDDVERMVAVTDVWTPLNASLPKLNQWRDDSDSD